MLWLFDSRDRLHGKRKFYRFPFTHEGKRQAWDIVLKVEVPNEIEDYAYLRDDDGGEDGMAECCGLFNDYWCVYGWCLVGMEPDAEVPHDAEDAEAAMRNEIVNYHNLHDGE